MFLTSSELLIFLLMKASSKEWKFDIYHCFSYTLTIVVKYGETHTKQIFNVHICITKKKNITYSEHTCQRIIC